MTEFRYTPAVLALIRERTRWGDYDWEIIGRLGCDPTSFDNICSQHGIEVRQDTKHGRTMLIALGTVGLARIAQEAIERGTSPQQLASKCLDYIANENLFAAVLDR